jgi:hypothetical protein
MNKLYRQQVELLLKIIPTLSGILQNINKLKEINPNKLKNNIQRLEKIL